MAYQEFDFNVNSPEAKPANRQKVIQLLRIAMVVALITVVEFIFAYTVPKGMMLYSIFGLLTMLKAGFIIWEFMHLGYEHKVLKWAVIFPTVVFLAWLAVALVGSEGPTLLEETGRTDGVNVVEQSE
ncbi:MAG: cytochrome C oxidase subunit IV family protein [Cytophagales bacterium]|nr:cytochrome C oxidase subunit IV family protein [Cytophagales bacterium]